MYVHIVAHFVYVGQASKVEVLDVYLRLCAACHYDISLDFIPLLVLISGGEARDRHSKFSPSFYRKK